MLLSAVGFVCLAALAVVFLRPEPEEPQKPIVVSRSEPMAYPEPEPEPEVEIAELKPQRVVPTKQRIPRAPKVTSGTLNLSIGGSSDRVTSINVVCGDFRQRASIRGGKASVEKVPLSTQCKLKFSPGGAIYTGSVGGKTLICTVTNGNSVTCKK